MGAEIYDKILGIIGIGRVGSIVADRALGLKMHVIAYDPFMSPEAAEKLGITLVALDELLAKADFISVHTPMTKDTKGMINAGAFGKMKKGVFIINCARGGIINEKDLWKRSMSGKVAGAALDVFEEEPTKNTELVALEQVICTPHLGASTEEAQQNVAIAIAEQIVDYPHEGRNPQCREFPLDQRRTPGQDPALSGSGRKARQVRSADSRRAASRRSSRIQRRDPQQQPGADHDRPSERPARARS